MIRLLLAIPLVAIAVVGTCLTAFMALLWWLSRQVPEDDPSPLFI